MRVGVSGANGFIGRALCHDMAIHGHTVVPLARITFDHHEAVVGEVVRSENCRTVLQGCEVVVHLAARAHVLRDRAPDPLAEFRKSNTVGSLILGRQAALAGVRRFIYVSSIGVNGNMTRGAPFTETSSARPHDSYSISKYEAEVGLMEIAKQTGMEVVIIRPPLVYGPGAKGNFATLVRWVRKGVPLPFGAVPNRRSLVALDNLVDFIGLCADRERSPGAANEVFLISDGEDVSTTELLRKVARAYGVQSRLVPVPARWLRFVAGLLGKGALADRLLGSLVVDSSKARELLGWRPVVTMDEQLRKMARHDAIL